MRTFKQRSRVNDSGFKGRVESRTYDVERRFMIHGVQGLELWTLSLGLRFESLRFEEVALDASRVESEKMGLLKGVPFQGLKYKAW